jgi:uncharacterized pyridoxamine 5'-phosphate oxidase family protein
MKETYDFLKKAGTYYLATVEYNQPHVRPFGTVNIFQDKLYIQTGKSKNVYKQISENPNIEICAFNDGKWIRVEGIAKEDDRTVARKAMLDAYPELRNMYDENDGNTVVFVIDKAIATISSFTEEPKVYRF